MSGAAEQTVGAAPPSPELDKLLAAGEGQAVTEQPRKAAGAGAEGCDAAMCCCAITQPGDEWYCCLCAEACCQVAECGSAGVEAIGACFEGCGECCMFCCECLGGAT